MLAEQGPEIPDEIVRLMLFLKVQSLAYGYSGVQVQTVQRLADYFNHKVYPIIYEMGSLGASGDLAPLAHLALTLIGQGEVHYEGKLFTGKQINEKMKWEPVHFQAKEGLALLNGTQFMNAYGVWCTVHASTDKTCKPDRCTRLMLSMGVLSHSYPMFIAFVHKKAR